MEWQSCLNVVSLNIEKNFFCDLITKLFLSRLFPSMRKVSKWLKDSPRTQDILLGMHKFFIVKFHIVNNYTMGENWGITINSLSLRWIPLVPAQSIIIILDIIIMSKSDVHLLKCQIKGDKRKAGTNSKCRFYWGVHLIDQGHRGFFR